MQADVIRFETLKLLVKVAWADLEVDRREVDYVLTLAEQLGAPEREVAELRVALADEGYLPDCNLHLLRSHAGDVMRAVDELIASDDRIVGDERAARDAIAALLRDA